MFALLSALVALGCVVASVRRLAASVSLTWLEPRLLVHEFRKGGALRSAALRESIVECKDAVWERALLSALDAEEPSARGPLVHEQLRELDWSAQRWQRAPRVCASIASSAGFLFGCAALVRGLDGSTGDVPTGLLPVLDAAAIGIAGACACIAVHLRCRRIVRERVADVDRLVECLEAQVGCGLDGPPPHGPVSERGGGTGPWPGNADHQPKPAAM
jgi:hypothetical protein